MDEIKLSPKDQEFLSEVEKINKELSKQSNLVDQDYLNAFDCNAQNLFRNIADEKNVCRLLRIGVIGCVKAGKSSFLNALLFDGKPILPKAATPMTAALTKLSYAEIPGATIHFFKQDDWARIEKSSKRYDDKVDQEYKRLTEEYQKARASMSVSQEYIPLTPPPTRQDAERSVEVSETLRACHEIVSMVEQNKIPVDQYLDKEETLQADNYEALMDRLGLYVGSQGALTPLVNHVELRINCPLLQDLEVIDTPGLNDPVVSRSMQTQEYLESCDVILLLSSVSQFLGEQEFSLLSKKLPKKGVNRIYLIGTQLDSGILQYPISRKNIAFMDAYNGSFEAYNQQAKRLFRKLLDSAPDSRSASLIQHLIHTDPLYICSLAVGIAKKREYGLPLDEGESHIIRQMKKRFPDFEETLSDADSYLEFSGFREVQKIFDNVRQEKKNILNSRAQECIFRHALGLLNDLENIQIAVQTTRDALKQEDVQSLKNKLQLLHDGLNSIRTEVSEQFRLQAVHYHHHIQNLKIEIGKLSAQYTGLQIDTRTTDEFKDENYGLFGLWSRTVHYKLTTKTANASEAVENVQQFAVKALGMINDNLKKAFDSDDLQKKIKECVIGVFDLSDTNFNSNEILLPLSVLLSSLSVAPITYDFLPQIQKEIYGAFDDTEGVVEGNAIHTLNRLQQEQLTNVLLRCEKLLDETDQKMQSQMELNAGEFVDKIQEKISGNIEMTTRMLDDREHNLHLCDTFLNQIGTYKAIMRNFCKKES